MIRTECSPVVKVVDRLSTRLGRTSNIYTDRSVVVPLILVDEERDIVTCEKNIQGKCQGKFPCWVNENDMYTTVKPADPNAVPELTPIQQLVDTFESRISGKTPR